MNFKILCTRHFTDCKDLNFLVELNFSAREISVVIRDTGDIECDLLPSFRLNTSDVASHSANGQNSVQILPKTKETDRVLQLL